MLARARRWIDDLRHRQETFDGSIGSVQLMRSLLAVLLRHADLEGRVSGGGGASTGLAAAVPDAYRAFRAELERRVLARPTVKDLAADVGYGARTVDRACRAVTGLSARQVVDRRLDLELRRHLADPSLALDDVRRTFGFHDASNFATFVRRHLDASPTEVRARFS